MNCNVLIEKYIKAVVDNSQVTQIGENCVLVTPYLHSHGVYITIFSNEENGKIRIHDNGETLQSLFSRGVSIFENPHREQLMAEICSAYKIDLAGWTLQKIVDIEHLGEGIIDLINALKSVNDMIFLHQATSSDVFKFEVRMYFKDKELNVTPDHKVNGRTTIHKIDFYYRKRQSDYFINLVHGSQLQAKVIRTGFSYYDIRERDKSSSWISVINPEDDWNKTSLNILNGFSTTISWEHKDKLLEILS